MLKSVVWLVCQRASQAHVVHQAVCKGAGLDAWQLGD